MTGKDWTSEYYDVMDFYYWEPQHLGKIKNHTSKYDNVEKALQHIQNMEVSLNHLFNVFFRLAPSDFVNQVLATACGTIVSDEFSMQDRYDVLTYAKELVQPDIFFTSNNSNFSIEMKLASKSSLEQVYKYAILHWLEQRRHDREKQSILMFIGSGSFESLWPEKYLDSKSLIQAALKMELGCLKSRALKERVPVDWGGVSEVLLNTVIGYCNYADFASLLINYRDSMFSDNRLFETVEKLFNGLYQELSRRELVTG